nr:MULTISPECIES: hypothetical protein [unclassified Thioalkalivibrio]
MPDLADTPLSLLEFIEGNAIHLQLLGNHPQQMPNGLLVVAAGLGRFNKGIQEIGLRPQEMHPGQHDPEDNTHHGGDRHQAELETISPVYKQELDRRQQQDNSDGKSDIPGVDPPGIP